MAEPPKQRYQGVQKESAGYRLLRSMGWQEGEGLGASKQGIKEHIRVKKKFENWGVGAIESNERARDWSAGMAEFHRVLSTLSEITSQHASKRQGDGATTSEEESDASDGELHKAEDGAIANQGEKEKEKSKSKKGSKKKEKKKEKKDRASKKRSKAPSDSEAEASGDGIASPDEEQLTVKRVKVATHLGRFKKRETAKHVKGYSAHDLAAILGEDPFAAAAATVAEVRADAAVTSSSDSDSDGEMAAARDAPSVQQETPTPAFTARRSEEAPVAHAAEDAGQWWSGYFMRSGRMGAMKRPGSKGIKAGGFSEQDQTDLYTRVQDGATQGRVGLGRSSMPKKVAGARWEGKRMKLGSDSEDEQEEVEDGDEERQQIEEGIEAEEGIVIVLPKNGRAAAVAVAGGEQVVQDGSGSLGSIKWKRAVVEVLQASASSMKLKAVVRAVMERQGLAKQHKGEVARLVGETVATSSKFALQGKVVRLAA